MFIYDFVRIEAQYEALKQKAKERLEKLEDALALYQLYNEADMVKTWVTQHVSALFMLPL